MAHLDDYAAILGCLNEKQDPSFMGFEHLTTDDQRRSFLRGLFPETTAGVQCVCTHLYVQSVVALARRSPASCQSTVLLMGCPPIDPTKGLDPCTLTKKAHPRASSQGVFRASCISGTTTAALQTQTLL